MINGYYFITDSSLSMAGNASDVKNAVAAGVKAVQYRNKNGTTKEMYDEALALKVLCKSILFLINNRLDIALAVGADGVHLGQDDMPYSEARRMLGKQKIIGITVHNIEEAKEAERMGADYLGISPVFSTSTKPDAGKPSGVELIRKIKKEISIPVVAIGGINLKNASEVVAAGSDGLCAISAVVASHDVASEIKKFQELFRGRLEAGSRG